MKGRVLVISAMVVYLSALGCALWPTTSSAVHSADVEPASLPGGAVRAESMPFVGIAMQVQDPTRVPEYLKAIDQIADEGADSVSLVVDSRQEKGSSSHVFMDLGRAPIEDQLSQIILHAKARKLRVLLMPIVLLQNPEGNEWRGMIHADDWNAWWDSYREMLGHYATIAQKTGVDVFSVGSELVSTERFADQWTQTIQMVRHLYGGLLTYSSNWDHYTSIPFWEQLDLMGMNSYYKLGDNRDVSVDEIVSRWHGIQKDLLKFQHRIGKPLILLEAGWCDVGNAADEPWDYTKDEVPLDLDLQRKLYEGFFRAWWGVPQMGGFMLWEWTLGGGGPADRGYTPQGKPAEQIMKAWFAKPRWNVKP
jgi:hypothetical protein